MAEHETTRARWPRDIAKGLRIMAWAALIGEVGRYSIAFVIPIVGGTRDSLWIARYWSIALEMLALAGLVLATRRPSATGASFTFGTSALVVRVLGFAAVLGHVIVAFLQGAPAGQELPLAVVLSLHTIRPAAKVLVVWYVGTLLWSFGVAQLGRAMHWTALALTALWIIDYPANIVVMMLVSPGGAIAWTYTIGVMILGVTLLVWTCVCLLKAAKRFPDDARRRCINCGYVLFETSRCSECGASYETASSD